MTFPETLLFVSVYHLTFHVNFTHEFCIVHSILFICLFVFWNFNNETAQNLRIIHIGSFQVFHFFLSIHLFYDVRLIIRCYPVILAVFFYEYVILIYLFIESLIAFFFVHQISFYRIVAAPIDLNKMKKKTKTNTVS